MKAGILKKRTGSMTTLGASAAQAVEEQTIPLDSITMDDRLLMRVEIDQGNVQEIREKIESGIVLDAIEVVRGINDSGEPVFWVTNGFHRTAAHHSAGKNEILAKIRPGTWEDAFQEALQANTRHGKKLTPADIRKKVIAALEFFGWDSSANFIATKTGTYPALVRGIMAERQNQKIETEEPINPLIDDNETLPDATPQESNQTDEQLPSATKKTVSRKKRVIVRRGNQVYTTDANVKFANAMQVAPVLREIVDDENDPLGLLTAIIAGDKSAAWVMDAVRDGKQIPEGYRVRRQAVVAAAKKLVAASGTVTVPANIWREILDHMRSNNPGLYEKLMEI